MIYITGDTHRDFRRVETFCNVTETTKDDILIILGDAGINYYGESNDNCLKEELSKLPITLFCILMKYIPREVFLSSIDQSTVDNSTEEWLDTIEDRLTYSRCYCGHYHTNKTIDRMRFLFEDFLELV